MSDLTDRIAQKRKDGLAPGAAIKAARLDQLTEQREQHEATRAARIVAAADARLAKVEQRQQAASSKLDGLRTLAAKVTQIPGPSPRVIVRP